MRHEQMQSRLGAHNYYLMSVFEALDRVRQSLADNGIRGYGTGYARARATLPNNVIAVGQCVVNSGDHPIYLYVFPNGIDAQ